MSDSKFRVRCALESTHCCRQDKGQDQPNGSNRPLYWDKARSDHTGKPSRGGRGRGGEGEGGGEEMKEREEGSEHSCPTEKES